ncbi:MAG: ADOP family duplicated permease, partial [Acidobacteriia bacterium]|nr:ADOP family duplicated permease [Terriglobia bacterium]
ARRAALLKLGGVEATKENCRERRGLPLLEHFARDLRYAGLSAVRNKGFTAVVVLTLALGIGAAALVFSVAHALFLRPLPYADADRLAVVRKAARSGGDKGLLSFRELQELKARGIFNGIAGFAYAAWPGVLSSGEEVELVSMVDVTEDFFTVLGVRPLLGSTPRPGQSGGIVLSHALWGRLFRARSDAVGRQVRLNGATRTVVGVMPAGFQLFRSDRAEVFAPDRAASNHPDAETLACVARLRGGVGLPATMREVARAAAPGESGGSERTRYEAADLRSRLFGEYRGALLTLSVAAAFFLLIACANVANLLLARMTVRLRELRIRVALGASRLRVAAQLLTEGLLTALAGGAAGLLLAHEGVRLLERLRMGGFRALPPFRIDGPVLGLTALLCLLVPLLCTLAPLLRFAVRGGAQLKECAPTVTPTHWRTGRAIVVCAMAFSLMLLVGAGLLASSFLKVARVDPGFKAANVIFLEFDDNRLFFEDIIRRQAFYDELVRRLQDSPEVAAAGQTDQVPLSDDVWNVALSASLATPPSGSSGKVGVFLRTVDAGFFRALKIPLRNGRLVEARDARGSPPVAVINEGFAQRVWGAANPLGQHLNLLGMDLTIVGVAGDVRESGLRNKPNDQILYVSTGQFIKGNRVLAVRATADPAAVVPAVKQLAHGLEPGAPALRVRSMSRIVSDSIAAERFSAVLMTALSALALALASVGVYAVVAFSVSQRTREFGVRLAMGARQGQILGLLLREEAPLVAAAAGLGALGGWVLMRFLAGQLYEVSPGDPLYFGIAALSVAAFAALASYLPARRASRADPVAALRWE